MENVEYFYLVIDCVNGVIGCKHVFNSQLRAITALLILNANKSLFLNAVFNCITKGMCTDIHILTLNAG